MNITLDKPITIDEKTLRTLRARLTLRLLMGELTEIEKFAILILRENNQI